MTPDHPRQRRCAKKAGFGTISFWNLIAIEAASLLYDISHVSLTRIANREEAACSCLPLQTPLLAPEQSP